MTNAELATIHAAAMAVPRPWAAHEIGALRLMPGAVEVIRPQGFALGRVTVDEGELLTVAVHPAAQSRGLGRAILNDFHDALRQRGAALCHLEVAEHNAPARALYAALGYTQTGRRRGYYTEDRPPQDAIVMALTL